VISLSPTILIVGTIAWGASGQTVTWLGIFVFAAVGLIVNLFLADRDRSLLINRGFERPASQYLALLPPFVYLAVRGNRVFNQVFTGLRPLWANVAQIVIWPIIATIVQLWGGAFQLLP
jgi:hypothetical protein